MALKICFYGAGSMAEAIVRGLLAKRLAPPGHISLLNRANNARLQELREAYGVTAANNAASKEQLLREADIIMLCMKPKDASAAIQELRGLLSGQQLIISVIAGLSIPTIEQLLGSPAAIVRTMPNTSSTIGLGATGISFSPAVTASQREQAEAIFASVGITAVVDEPLIDTVTAVSGSGPAYIYYMMEAMIAAGQQLGLAAADARELTVQTVLGAARMVQETGEQPADLRHKVTSPGGTTQAALDILAQRQFQESVLAAMERAKARAGELGKIIEGSINE